MHSEALREQMKEKKRREKEVRMRDQMMPQCLNVQNQEDNKIPQLDGPTSDPHSDGTVMMTWSRTLRRTRRITTSYNIYVLGSMNTPVTQRQALLRKRAQTQKD